MTQHAGRAWAGHAIEDACECMQVMCGLVAHPSPDCPQHGFKYARTMRQGHRAEDCPALIPVGVLRLTGEQLGSIEPPPVGGVAVAMEAAALSDSGTGVNPR